MRAYVCQKARRLIADGREKNGSDGSFSRQDIFLRGDSSFKILTTSQANSIHRLPIRSRHFLNGSLHRNGSGPSGVLYAESIRFGCALRTDGCPLPHQRAWTGAVGLNGDWEGRVCHDR